MRRLLAILLFTTTATAADSPTAIWSPTTILPAATTGDSFAAANVLTCFDWIPIMGIQSATALAWKLASGTPTVGVAIYANGGGLRIATAPSTVSSGVTTSPGLTPFNIDAGGLYRTCWCATDNLN